MKQILSDFISLIFGKPEKGDTHSWREIGAVIAFLLITAFLLTLGTV